MPILAIDTASRWTAIALYDEDQQVVIAEKGWTATLRQTVELAPAIEKILEDSKLNAADLTAISVAIGPGSYTGLRIGMGLARGLALVHNLPIAAIQTHDIVAANIPHNEQTLMVAVEAGRKRVLMAPYLWQNGRWEQVGSINNPTWAEFIGSVSEPTIVAGEVSTEAREMIVKTNALISLVPDNLSVRSAGTLARLGHQQIISGSLLEQETLAPVYLRNP